MDTQDEQVTLPEEARTDGFRIDSRDRAEWLLAKLSHLKAEKEWVQRNAADITARLDAEHDKLMARFGEELRAWAEGELKGARTKTLPLLNGKLSFRTQPERLVLDAAQRDDAIAWAREHAPDAVVTRTTVTLDAVAVKDALSVACAFRGQAVIDKDTGQVLMFAAVEPAREEFYVKPGGGK